MKSQFGLIGLAVMGQNLALNVADQGFKVSVYNRTEATTREFIKNKQGIIGTLSLESLVNSLERPRIIQLMVQAGKAVDTVLDQLKPLLDKGDIVIDGGNSYFLDTERRAKVFEAAHLNYVGMGVSGGEEGARYGPSLMPGGTQEAYQQLEPILTAIAAKVPTDGTPCVTHLGPRGAGHYVKMVHNGIEYGIMQLIAESYALLQAAIQPTPQEFHDIFREWNKGELASFLIEITANIFTKNVDEKTALIDLILDQAEQKGTGRWTTQNALEIGVAVPTITAAVEARLLSALKPEREAAAKILSGPPPPYTGYQRRTVVEMVRAALCISIICSYAQGMALLKKAAIVYDYQFDLAEIARIWRAGCIIRSILLEFIKYAYEENPELPNLLVAPALQSAIKGRRKDWRETIKMAVDLGVSVPAMSASLAYFDAYRSARLPANLIQAQRDYFGAHTFRRVDKTGSFHADWTAGEEDSP